MSGQCRLRPGPMPGVSIAWVNLDRPLSPSETLDGWLSPTEREQAERFRFEVHRRRYVVARGTLRRLLADQLGLVPSGVPIETDGFGKPRLAVSSGSDLRFSLSHTAGRALYAFAAGREVGVDAEAMRPLPDMDALVHDVFSPSELVEWRSVPVEQRVEAFFNGWTRKEAFVKALGRGLDFPLAAFDVSLTPGTEPRLLRVSPEGGPVTRWSMHAWSPEPGFAAALVVDSGSDALSR